MGQFIRVWVPDHFIVAMERSVAAGEYADSEELIHVSVAEELGIPSVSADDRRERISNGPQKRDPDGSVSDTGAGL